MILIYPEDYVPPDPPDPVVLTVGQRAALKTRMQNYINNQGVPIPIKTLIDDCQQWLISTYNKHVAESDIRDIALEIRSEWGAPGE
jgi:hypothetical protein